MAKRQNLCANFVGLRLGSHGACFFAFLKADDVFEHRVFLAKPAAQHDVYYFGTVTASWRGQVDTFAVFKPVASGEFSASGRADDVWRDGILYYANIKIWAHMQPKNGFSAIRRP